MNQLNINTVVYNNEHSQLRNISGGCNLNNRDLQCNPTSSGMRMKIIVTGGYPPYTIRIKNITGNELLPNGEYFNLGWPGPSIIDNMHSSNTVVTTFVIKNDGGHLESMGFEGSYNDNIIFVSGTFDIEVTDSSGLIKTVSRNWSMSRISEKN